MERKVLMYWLAQFGGWGAYYVFSILLLKNTFTPTYNLFLWILSSILFSVLLSHGIRFVILGWKWLNFKLGKLIVYSISLALLASVLLELFQSGLDYVIVPDFLVNESALGEEPFDLLQFTFAVSRSLILFLLWMGFYYVFAVNEKSRKQEIANLQWEASKNEIELKNLRAQLNPHFLFNSLNSIRALVGLNPEQAKTSITRLSSLLRESINLGKLKVISLNQELELVKSYLDLEQIRFEERLKLEFAVAENSLHCEIPPLMVQTIVENGIKHGISKSIDGGIVSVKTTFENKTLELEVSNTGKLDTDEASKGIGLENSRKRLSILFGDRADLNIRQDGDLVMVLIKITYA
ncbi:MAG: histidine kinase [Flavobacteriales bacterium]|nr:histidine kinase [Flavobacteriales bacterium]